MHIYLQISENSRDFFLIGRGVKTETPLQHVWLTVGNLPNFIFDIQISSNDPRMSLDVPEFGTLEEVLTSELSTSMSHARQVYLFFFV